MTRERIEGGGRAAVVAAAAVAAAIALAVGAPAASATGWPKNGLSSRALRANALTANARALALLAARPLGQALVEDPYIAHQLRDPAARAVMDELVRCALAPEASITYTYAHGGASWTWRGELGLCRGGEAGDWAAAPPTPACQELVTACVLARVNALGAAVPLSLRAEAGPLAERASRVPAEPTFREGRGDDPSQGTPVADLAAGWSAAYVGTCRGGEVALSAAGAAALRVCAGIHACNGPDALGPVRPYSQFAGESAAGGGGALGWGAASGGGAVRVPCPTAPGVAGYFAVMYRGPAGGAPPAIDPAGAARYPASEVAVFGVAEGAFYGNLFEPGTLAHSCEVTADGARRACRPCAPAARGAESSCGAASARQDPKQGGGAEVCPLEAADCGPRGLPHRRVYACHAEAGAAVAVAYFNSRLCGLGGGAAACFETAPAPCALRCDAVPAAGGGGSIWRSCRGGDGARAYRPITTYLNAPCDLIGGGALCERLVREGGDRRGGCGGCGRCGGGARTCSAGGGLQAGAGAVLVALLLRRRRRR